MNGNLTSHFSKRLTTILSVMTVGISLFAAPQSDAAGGWTNEPAGSRVVLDCPFNNGSSGCGILDVYSSAVAQSDSSAPMSPNGIATGIMSRFSPTGGMQLVYNWGTTREAFIGLTWRTNPDYGGRPVGNKLFFMLGPEAGGVFLMGVSALNNGCAPLIWGTNTLNYNNYHICEGSLICYPNVNPSAAIVCRGQWYKIEVYFKSSTTATSKDGIWRWWVNGVLVGNYTTANWNPAGQYEWQWNNTWDGSGDMQNLPRAADWSHSLDHLYISIPNGAGSSTDNPPGPPAAPTLRTVTIP